MGKKAAKSARKFAAKGHLKKTIEQRRKHQQIKKKTQGRRGAPTKLQKHADPEVEEEDEDDAPVEKKKTKLKSVDDILGAEFMDEDSENEDEGSQDGSDDDEDDEEEDLDDSASFGSVDDLDEGDEGKGHMHELAKLAEKDPEFFKYLQENDKELLDFDPNDVDDEEDFAMGDEDNKAPVLTKDILAKWQKALLDARSLRALRKLLIAFRSAAHMNDDEQVTLAWRIDSSAVYDKLLTTTFRYTPVVLAHHIPFKTLPNGKIKPPSQTNTKFKALQKLILSYFHNATYLLGQLSDTDMLQTGLSETSKLLAYVMSSRKSIKAYLKRCLDLWSTSTQDTVRMTAFLALRNLGSSTDAATLDNVMKQSYTTLVKHFGSTNAHTLEGITFLKNTCSELYTLDHAAAYQHAFGYIRQMAIKLRNSMKVKTKDSYKAVYNWRFAHEVDFWCLVLGRASSTSTSAGSKGGKAKESELKALIYPLIQVSLGAIRLIPNSRSYPFHLHLTRSLLHLIKHTQTYIPLSAILIPILTSLLSPSSTSKAKKSTLKPLDLELHIRAPAQYLKTRVYTEGVTEEATYVLAEWLASDVVQGNWAFPEVSVPVCVSLKKALKKANAGGGGASGVKVLLERIGESVKWVEERRRGVSFGGFGTNVAPLWSSTSAAAGESKGKGKKGDGEPPLVKYVKVLRKQRERQREVLDKARKGQGEIVREDGDEDSDDE